MQGFHRARITSTEDNTMSVYKVEKEEKKKKRKRKKRKKEKKLNLEAKFNQFKAKVFALSNL